MNQVSVRGELLALPKMCCCCCDPKAKKRFQALGKYTGLWVNTRYREKRWLEFPLCKRCDQWIRAGRAARGWLGLGLGTLVLGLIAIVPAALAGFRPVSGLVWGGIAAGMILFAVLSLVLWRVRRSRARRLDPGPPCTPRPVVLTEWLRNKNTFRFSNRDYFEHFCGLNRDLIE